MKPDSAGGRQVSDRLEKLIHHVTTLGEPDELGRTRIAKILWLSDIEYFRLTGKTITHSDEYVKDDFGPRHRILYTALDHLKRDQKIVEQVGLTTVGSRHEYVPIAPTDLVEFLAEEIAIVDRVTAKVIRMSARQVSELTHDELWTAAYQNERIPVAAAAPVAGRMTPEILAWAEGIHDEHSAPA